MELVWIVDQWKMKAVIRERRLMDTVVDMEIDVVVSSLFPFLNEP